VSKKGQTKGSLRLNMVRQLNAHAPQENRNVLLPALPKQKNPSIQAKRNSGENDSGRDFPKADSL
jgi:hypothetical protein